MTTPASSISPAVAPFANGAAADTNAGAERTDPLAVAPTRRAIQRSDESADDLRHRLSEMGRERDECMVRAEALERRADAHAEAAALAVRRLELALAEVAALRTSTSWRLTKPLRFASKSVAALKKGPGYWRHLYAVRAQALQNWRRENGGEPVQSLPLPPPSPAPQWSTGVTDARPEMHQSVPLTDRARRAFKRARSLELR